MSDNEAEKIREADKDAPVPLWLLVLIVVVLWALSAVAISWWYGTPAERSQVGDMFGAVNALFSGLAFAILIYTMWLQKTELGLQRAELRQTRSELRRTANAQEKAQRAAEASSRMAAWVELQKLWTDPVFTEQRRMLLTRRRQGPQEPWSADDLDTALHVCRRTDSFCRLAPFFGEDNVLKIWDDPIAKLWRILELIVEKERNATGWATKWDSFERLGRAAQAKMISEGRDPAFGLE
jgi:hypothetical protein